MVPPSNTDSNTKHRDIFLKKQLCDSEVAAECLSAALTLKEDSI